MSEADHFPSLAPGTVHERVHEGCSCGWTFTAVEVGGHWFNMTINVGGKEMDGYDAHMLVVRNPSAYYHRNMTVEDQKVRDLRIHGPMMEGGIGFDPTLETGG